MFPPSLWSQKDLSQVCVWHLPSTYDMRVKDFPLTSVSTQIHRNHMMASEGIWGSRMTWMVTHDICVCIRGRGAPPHRVTSSGCFTRGDQQWLWGVSGDRVSGLSKQRTQAHSWGRGHMGRSEPQPAHVTFHAPVTAPERPEGANAPPISFSAASAECLGTRLWASWMDCRLQSGWNWVPVPALLTGPCP